MCDGKFSWGSDGVGKGAACGGESGLGSGVVGGALFKAGLSKVMEPRRDERGGGDGRSNGDTEATDAKNPLRVAKRLSGHDGAVPVKTAVCLRVRLVWRSRVSFS